MECDCHYVVDCFLETNLIIRLLRRNGRALQYRERSAAVQCNGNLTTKTQRHKSLNNAVAKTNTDLVTL